MSTLEFVRKNRHADVSALALRMRQYPEMDAAFVLQQIEGWQKASQKLPELAAIDGWLWPKRVSVEQCSSQATALYKKAVLEKWTMDNGQLKMGGQLIDLTGGMGVDTFYLSEGFEEAHYVERDEELCRLAENNFTLTGKKIQVHCCEAEEWLQELREKSEKSGAEENGRRERVIFVDPARRDKHGGKVFRLEDCEPNVVELLTILRACAGRIMLKLSPMLDITSAVRSLGGATEVHVVAVKNEVKEVLILLETGRDNLDPGITCVNLETEEERFVFRKSEEEENRANEGNKSNVGEEFYLVEPNSAIQKAGGWKSFGARYGLEQLGPNSHLFFVPEVTGCMHDVYEGVAKTFECFCKKEGSKKMLPGRIFLAKTATKEELKTLNQANVICRNYPMSADALKKKLRVRDGGEKYIIATQIGQKPVIFLGVRQFLHN